MTRRSRATPFAVVPVATALLLSGCTADGERAPSSGTEPPPGSNGVSPPPAAPLPPSPPLSLEGLDEASLEHLFGAASFRRSDGPSELLQFRNDRCVIDVFLYLDAPGGVPRVAHAETRGHNLEAVAEAPCWRSLMRRPDPQTPG